MREKNFMKILIKDIIDFQRVLIKMAINLAIKQDIPPPLR